MSKQYGFQSKDITMTKTDLQLKQDVDDELCWDPKVNAEQIDVPVEAGAVSLKGAVVSYADKRAAEEAAKRVAGVRSVTENLQVKVLELHGHTDLDIAKAARSALKWDVWVPKTVTLNVEQGKLSLNGAVDWNFQRNSAERAVRNLAGVVDVFNSISIKAAASVGQVQGKIQAALQRHATADTIQVVTSGGTVTLSGNASSWHAIEYARDAAWAAPGVTQVVEEVAISGFSLWARFRPSFDEQSSMNAAGSRKLAARQEILKFLSEVEVARIIEEEGGRLSHGEEYIDLVHLPQGVRRALTSDALNMKDFIRRRAVSDQTWSRICSTFVGESEE